MKAALDTIAPKEENQQLKTDAENATPQTDTDEKTQDEKSEKEEQEMFS